MNETLDEVETSISAIDISNLELCTDDIRDGWSFGSHNYNNLLNRLKNCKDKLPDIYIKELYEPFLEYLQGIGEEKFNEILDEDKELERLGGIIIDVAYAILQRGEKYCEKPTNAFQALVSDLYDGFLSDEDRKNVKKPDKSIIAPLVKWGNPEFGPYTWPVDATKNVGVNVAIVNLPPSHARGSLLGWSTIGHETGGHDILHADTGLLEELQNNIESSLNIQWLNKLAKYWSERVDETASDILGILNMGPAAGIGLIGYFRGIIDAIYGEPKLNSVGSLRDPHPADILRGYLAAEAVKLLDFSEKNNYAKIIEEETNKDLKQIKLGNETFDIDSIRKSCKIVADTIINTKLKSLENHSLGEIQNWHDEDEDIANKLRIYLRNDIALPEIMDSNVYATHVVAASVYEAISKNSNLSLNFKRMIDILDTIHYSRVVWGKKDGGSNRVIESKFKRISLI